MMNDEGKTGSEETGKRGRAEKNRREKQGIPVGANLCVRPIRVSYICACPIMEKKIIVNGQLLMVNC
jgi:hypothetical protein